MQVLTVEEEATLEQKVAAIEADLARPRTRLGLRPELEDEYRARTGPEREASLWRWHLAAMFANLAFLPLDYSAGVLEEALILRIGVVTPLYLAGLVLLSRGPGWVRAAAAVVPFVAFITTAVLLGTLSAAPHADRYLMGTGFAIPFANIAVPFRFRHAVALSASALAFMLVIVLSMSEVSQETVGLCAFVTVISLFSLAVRFRSERAARDAFLGSLRDEIKSARLVALTQALSRLADTDPLTGLYNRRHLTQVLRDRWREAEERNDWLGVLMIDVDRFKDFNDTAGHEEGDRCLRAIADRLNQTTSAAGQYLARFGGEEFMAVLSGLEPDPALEQAEQLRRSIEDMNVPHPGLPAGSCVTVSIGASVLVPSRQLSVTDLVAAADKALYEAKAAGRNRVASGPVMHLPGVRIGRRASDAGGAHAHDAGLDRRRRSGNDA